MNNFSLKYYQNMVEKALKEDFVISSFKNYNSKNKKTIILRHDIDFSLNSIPEIAKIEKDLNVTSTFFFRLHSPNYNLYASNTFKIIQDLIEKNHEIGFHFETILFSKIFDLNLKELFSNEISIFEKIISQKINSVSEHYDINNTIYSLPKLDKFIDFKKLKLTYAYDKRFFKDMKYISDSNAFWQDGDILKNLNFLKLQVLTHPELWGDSPRTYDHLVHHEK